MSTVRPAQESSSIYERSPWIVQRTWDAVYEPLALAAVTASLPLITLYNLGCYLFSSTEKYSQRALTVSGTIAYTNSYLAAKVYLAVCYCFPGASYRAFEAASKRHQRTNLVNLLPSPSSISITRPQVPNDSNKSETDNDVSDESTSDEKDPSSSDQTTKQNRPSQGVHINSNHQLPKPAPAKQPLSSSPPNHPASNTHQTNGIGDNSKQTDQERLFSKLRHFFLKPIKDGQTISIYHPDDLESFLKQLSIVHTKLDTKNHIIGKQLEIRKKFFTLVKEVCEPEDPQYEDLEKLIDYMDIHYDVLLDIRQREISECLSSLDVLINEAKYDNNSYIYCRCFNGEIEVSLNNLIQAFVILSKGKALYCLRNKIPNAKETFTRFLEKIQDINPNKAFNSDIGSREKKIDRKKETELINFCIDHLGTLEEIITKRCLHSTLEKSLKKFLDPIKKLASPPQHKQNFQPAIEKKRDEDEGKSDEIEDQFSFQPDSNATTDFKPTSTVKVEIANYSHINMLKIPSLVKQSPLSHKYEYQKTKNFLTQMKDRELEIQNFISRNLDKNPEAADKVKGVISIEEIKSFTEIFHKALTPFKIDTWRKELSPEYLFLFMTWFSKQETIKGWLQKELELSQEGRREEKEELQLPDGLPSFYSDRINIYQAMINLQVMANEVVDSVSGIDTAKMREQLMEPNACDHETYEILKTLLTADKLQG